MDQSEEHLEKCLECTHRYECTGDIMDENGECDEYEESMSESILKILENEPIRLVDGRYSDGFASTDDLNKLIKLGGYVEVYEKGGMKFVRRKVGKK